MASKTLGEIKLNEAIGFATVLAALDAIKGFFEPDGIPATAPAVAFLVYFFVFRVKMYNDDAHHDFLDNVDVTIAITSWACFLVSVAALHKSLNTAVAWCCAALGVSCVWTIYSCFRKAKRPRDPRAVRYGFFLAVNLLHIGLLWNFGDRVWTYVVLTLTVFADGLLLAKIDARWPQTKPAGGEARPAPAAV